jgi:hypothetical protein
MHFEILGEISDIEIIATGRGIACWQSCESDTAVENGEK